MEWVLPGQHHLTRRPAIAGTACGCDRLLAGDGLQFSSFERNPKLSGAHQWNFNIQHQLAGDWLIEAGYSGSRGLHLLRQYDANFPVPGPGALNTKRRYRTLEIPGTGIIAPLADVWGHKFDGNPSYHALLTKVGKSASAVDSLC